jgi:hypothetical protein
MKAKGILDKSGSCSLTAMIINDKVYMANVGDSRAVLSMNHGKKVVQLTKDHKPLDELEYRRIIHCGGQVTQLSNVVDGVNAVKMGPYRVFPGGLAVLSHTSLTYLTMLLDFKNIRGCRSKGPTIRRQAQRCCGSPRCDIVPNHK